jgi:hypothetical protein
MLSAKKGLSAMQAARDLDMGAVERGGRVKRAKADCDEVSQPIASCVALTYVSR